MRNKRSLKDIPIEQNSNELIRKYDAISKKQKYTYLFLFLFVNGLFYVSQKFGPPFYHIETIPIDKSSINSNTRKFLLKIGDFNFLNDFITLDLLLLKNNGVEESKFVDASLTIKSIKGKRSEILSFQNSKKYKIIFSSDSNVSNKIRLYSRGIVDFVRLETDLVLKFHSGETNEENNIYSGAFIITYVDASHAIIEALLRLIYFIIGIIWLFYFSSIDITKTSTPLQLRLIHFTLILIVFASNPLYILSYFTESPFLPFLDSVFAIILIFSVLASTLVILDSTHQIESNLSRKWFFLECLPFAVTGSFFFINECFMHYSTDTDIIFQKLMQIIKYASASVCLILLFISFLLFKTKNYLEKGIVLCMIFVTISITIFLECFESIEPLISSNHAIQIFSFASVSTYVFFLALFYMPVDPLTASDDLNNDYNNYYDEDENSYDVADTS